jgi:transposase
MARPAAPFRLTPEQQAELRARLRQATVAPRLRVRLRCVQLRDQGWTVPQVARQLAVSQATVWRALRRVRAGGLDALADRPRPGRPPRLSDHDLDAVQALLHQAARQGTAWTARELAGWLAQTRRGGDQPGPAGSVAASAGLPLDGDPAARLTNQGRRVGVGASRRTSSWLMAR